MARLKSMTQEEFTLLYNALPVKKLAAELKIDENIIYKRRDKYNLPRKQAGHPIDYAGRKKVLITKEMRAIIDRVVEEESHMYNNRKKV